MGSTMMGEWRKTKNLRGFHSGKLACLDTIEVVAEFVERRENSGEEQSLCDACEGTHPYRQSSNGGGRMT